MHPDSVDVGELMRESRPQFRRSASIRAATAASCPDRREQCVSIERVADAGSVSAYFGNVHIILTFARDGAPSRRVRLHPESTFTMTGTARASDRLANELEQWTGAVTVVETKE